MPKQDPAKVTATLARTIFNAEQLPDATVGFVAHPRSKMEKRGEYQAIKKVLEGSKIELLEGIAYFIDLIVIANEAAEHIEIGGKNGVPIMRVKFHSKWAAEQLSFNLLGQANLQAVVEEESTDGLYLFVFEG